MKKILLILAILSQYIFASVEQVTINKHEFRIVTKSYDVEDTKGKYIKLYKDEKMLFRFTLKDSTGSCSAKSLIDGHYEIEGNKITLYSFWNRRGKAYLAPYGARIQIYEVLTSGELKLISARVYVEASKYKLDKDSGMRFLFKTPKNKIEKKELQQYVSEIEKQYVAEFIFGEEAKLLIQEVRESLRRKMKSSWRH